MRKPRDYDAELKALDDKARTLKARKVAQLGELVMATGADMLDAETLAGGLLAMVEVSEPARKESWRKCGHAFFQRRTRRAGRTAADGDGGADADHGGEAASRSPAGAT